mmetsp:Transcript_46816/g.121247  ORF Transcript_46816/g.121247 Transcript_46816/m.121247 type:complete len:259 (+) Transcript_46816:336-1112(+)
MMRRSSSCWDAATRSSRVRGMSASMVAVASSGSSEFAQVVKLSPFACARAWRSGTWSHPGQQAWRYFSGTPAPLARSLSTTDFSSAGAPPPACSTASCHISCVAPSSGSSAIMPAVRHVSETVRPRQLGLCSASQALPSGRWSRCMRSRRVCITERPPRSTCGASESTLWALSLTPFSHSSACSLCDGLCTSSTAFCKLCGQSGQTASLPHFSSTQLAWKQWKRGHRRIFWSERWKSSCSLHSGQRSTPSICAAVVVR